MNRYSEIHVALDFADKYGASNVTIETDDGQLTDTPARITEVWGTLSTGESFSLISINWER
jgi:hypothetical protein